MAAKAVHLWQEASLEQKQRLQDFLVPTGLTWDRERFGALATGLFFNRLGVETDTIFGMLSRRWPTFVIQRSGLTVASGAKTGDVTLIQRFGSALNLHLLMLFLDGSYAFGGQRVSFPRARRPSNAELVQLFGTLNRRMSAFWYGAAC